MTVLRTIISFLFVAAIIAQGIFVIQAEVAGNYGIAAYEMMWLFFLTFLGFLSSWRNHL